MKINVNFLRCTFRDFHNTIPPKTVTLLSVKGQYFDR